MIPKITENNTERFMIDLFSPSYSSPCSWMKSNIKLNSVRSLGMSQNKITQINKGMRSYILVNST